MSESKVKLIKDVEYYKLTREKYEEYLLNVIKNIRKDLVSNINIMCTNEVDDTITYIDEILDNWDYDKFVIVENILHIKRR